MPPSETATGSFEIVTRLAAVSDGVFTADISPGWTIGGRPNGGYLLSLLGRAATAVTTHDHVIAASAHYLRPPDPGPATIRAEVLRAGRTASQVRVRLEQEQACAEALVTVADLDPTATPYWSGGVPDPGDVAFDDAVPLDGLLPNGVRVSMMEQVEVRLDPASIGFATGRPGGRGELRGWLSLAGGAPFDPIALLFAVDAFPPATFDLELSGWVPTFELTVYVRALPAPGPVRILQRAQLIDGQRLDETCFVWDRTGRLVAQGTQLAGIRLG